MTHVADLINQYCNLQTCCCVLLQLVKSANQPPSLYQENQKKKYRTVPYRTVPYCTGTFEVRYFERIFWRVRRRGGGRE